MAFGVLVIALSALAMWLLIAGTASAVSYYVDPAGNDGNACTAPGASACLTIQGAVNKAAAGDTINVAAGTYSAGTIVNKTVTINGANAGIDPRTSGCAPTGQTIVTAGIDVQANNVVIDGITVQNVQPPDPLGVGIYYRPTASGYLLQNSLIQNNTFGVYLNSNGASLSTVRQNCLLNNNLPGPASGNGLYSDQGLSNALIQHNYSSGNSNASYIMAELPSSPVTGLTIDANDMNADSDIVLFNTHNSAITNNTSENSPYEMVYLGGGDTTLDISHNTGTKDHEGGVTLDDSLGYGPNTSINIHDNTFDGDGSNAAYGVRSFAGGATTGLVANHNILTDDRQGVTIDTATSPVVMSNNVSGFFQATGDATGIRVVNSTGITVNTNTINGGHTGSCSGGFWGIHVQNSGGQVDTNTVSGIGNALTNGCQEGRAIEADGAGTLDISGNGLTTYQKSGIIVRDTINSTISNNTATGEGPSGIIAENGITVTSSGSAQIVGNHTSNHRYTPESAASCGILTFNTVTVTGNDSTHDEVGLCIIGGSGSDVGSNHVTGHTQQGILVDSATNVNVHDNTIDGQGNGTTSNPGSGPDTDVRYYGIFAVDSTGNISGNTVHGITHGASNGLQSGVGIRLSARSGNSANMTIATNNVYDYQKGGIVVLNPYGGTSVTANVTGNTVTGSGPVNYIAQNGIQISAGANATVDGNNVSNNNYTPQTAAAVGLLVIGAGNVMADSNNLHDNLEGAYVQGTSGVSFTNNTMTNAPDTGLVVYQANGGTYDKSIIHDNTYGIFDYAGNNNTYSNSNIHNNSYNVVIDGPSNADQVLGNLILDGSQEGVNVSPDSGNPTNVVAHQNCIAGNVVYGMDVDPSLGVVNAENNWWGAADGPGPVGPGSGDKVTTQVDFTPFLTSPTNANCPSNATPTPVVTNSPTPVVTNSPTPVVTNSPTPVVTNSPTPVVTNSPTPAVTNSPTPVVTNSPTPHVTNSPTPVVTNSPTPHVTNSPTPSPTVLPASATPVPTPRPRAVGGFVDVLTTGGGSGGSGSLSWLLLVLITAISAVTGSGLWALLRRRS
jgi:parallel beta-helix repeat protein